MNDARSIGFDPYASGVKPPRPGGVNAWHSDINVQTYYFRLPPLANPECVFSRLVMFNIQWIGKKAVRADPRQECVAVEIPQGCKVSLYVIDNNYVGEKSDPGPVTSLVAGYKAPPKPGRLKLLKIEEKRPPKPGHLSVKEIRRLGPPAPWRLSIKDVRRLGPPTPWRLSLKDVRRLGPPKPSGLVLTNIVELLP